MLDTVRAALTRDKRRRTALWVFVGLLVFFSAVQYLRVTQLFPLGGDDQIGNLSRYYRITRTTFTDFILMQLRGIWENLKFKGGRFFPFGCFPRYLEALSCKSIETYRQFLVIRTLAVAACFGFLVARLVNSNAAGMSVFALVPLMFCLWSDYALNGLYSYEGLVMSPLLSFSLAGLCMVRWAHTRHWFWAIEAALLQFVCCGTYETGYTYIFAGGFMALMLHDKFWDSVRTGLPLLVGELAALFFYLGNRIMTGTRYSGVQVGGTSQGMLMTWLQQMSGGFPLNEPLAAGVQVHIPYSFGDIVWPLLLAGIAGACLYFAKVRLTGKQLLCLFMAGASMLAGPALLMGISRKYQSSAWIDWTHAYIPAAAESFGTALMAFSLWVAILQGLRSLPRGKLLCAGAAAAVILGLTCGSAWQRAATRERSLDHALERYELLAAAFEDGIADGVGTDEVICMDYGIWDSSPNSQSIFLLRYTDRNLTGWPTGGWEELSQQRPEDTGYYRVSHCHGYESLGGIWMLRLNKGEVLHGSDLTVYVDGNVVAPEAELRYTVEDGAGQQTVAIPLSALEHIAAKQPGCYFVKIDDENILSEGIRLICEDEG